MKTLAATTSLSVLVMACLLSGGAGCGQASPDNNAEALGSVGLGLQVSPGDTVSEATYTISGPNGVNSAGSVVVGDDANVPVTVSHLPIANGYEMDVTATASDGVTTCEGSASFDVTSGMSTVIVHLVCAVPAGDLNVSAAVNICPMLDSLGANPSSAALGGIVALTSSAHDSDNGPSPLSYKWTANGAPLQQFQPNLSFICSSVGLVTFTVTASDGDSTPGCPDSLSVEVRCSAP
jgi:hypothetical protein